MGLFPKISCAVCGNDCGLNRYPLKDKESVCVKCFKAARFGPTTPIKTMTRADVESAIALADQDANELSVFNETKAVAGWLKIDEEQRKWYIPDGFAGKTKRPRIHSFDDVIDYELLEDGNSMTKGGLGRAAVGGALLGGFGAVVGGVTGGKKSKSTCTTLKVKITLSDMSYPTEYINFITSETKKDGFLYKTIAPQAQECLSLFQLMCSSQQSEVNNGANATANSAADEIKKFKELLDLGAITQEEYDAKKQQLLGM